MYAVCGLPVAFGREEGSSTAMLLSASNSGGLVHHVPRTKGTTISVPRGQPHSAGHTAEATRQHHQQKRCLDWACCCSLTPRWVTKRLLSATFPAGFRQVLAQDQGEFNDFDRFLLHYSIYYLYYNGVGSAAALQIPNKGGSLPQIR